MSTSWLSSTGTPATFQYRSSGFNPILVTTMSSQIAAMLAKQIRKAFLSPLPDGRTIPKMTKNKSWIIIK